MAATAATASARRRFFSSISSQSWKTAVCSLAWKERLYPRLSSFEGAGLSFISFTLSFSFRLIAVGRSSHFFLSLSRHSSLSFNVGKMTRFSPSIHPSILSLSLSLPVNSLQNNRQRRLPKPIGHSHSSTGVFCVAQTEKRPKCDTDTAIRELTLQINFFFSDSAAATLSQLSDCSFLSFPPSVCSSPEFLFSWTLQVSEWVSADTASHHHHYDCFWLFTLGSVWCVCKGGRKQAKTGNDWQAAKRCTEGH